MLNLLKLLEYISTRNEPVNISTLNIIFFPVYTGVAYVSVPWDLNYISTRFHLCLEVLQLGNNASY